MVVIQSPIASDKASVGGPCALCGARRLSVCSALVDDGLLRLGKVADDLALSAGDALVREGDPAGHLYSITGGSVRVYKLLPDGRRQIVGFLYPGDFLGFGAGDRYAFSAEALEPVTACRFRKAEYGRLVRELPELEAALLERAGSELAAAQEQMLLLGRKTAQERVASFLLDTARRQHRAGGAVDRLRLTMTRSEIADYLGLTTETVSRVTSRLKVNGLIRLLSLSEILILRPEALQAIARGQAGATSPAR